LDLRQYIESIKPTGEFELVKGADWNLEIGAITDMNARRRGPCLLFDEIKGYPKGYRVLTCMLGGPKRLSLTLGLGNLENHNQIVSALEGKPTEWESKAANYPPHYVSSSELMQNKFSSEDNNIDFLKFPTPYWHEGDGGRYIGTGGTVITRDPEGGKINLGTYRVMIQGKDLVGVHIEKFHHGSIHVRKYHKEGKPCPVVLSFGHDPLVFVASSLPVPYEIPELGYAGAVRGEPIDVIEGPVTGLPIPASSEIAVEGYIYPDDLMDEGPFGEFTGYFGGERAPRAVLRPKAVYHRNDPIILGSLTSKPPHDYSYFRTIVQSASVKDRLRRAGVPGVTGVWYHECGCLYFWSVVAIKQQYPGHARQAGHVAALCGEVSGWGRYIIVVDDDIDPTNLEDVVWALSTRSDPATSTDFIQKTSTGSLDPLARKPAEVFYTSRAVIVACKPYEWMDKFPKVVQVSNELKAQVRAKWPMLFPA
jgi:UbiD family decarboxylase